MVGFLDGDKLGQATEHCSSGTWKLPEVEQLASQDHSLAADPPHSALLLSKKLAASALQHFPKY